MTDIALAPAKAANTFTPIVIPIERLDRSRSFGTVFGIEARKIRYLQAGLGLADWPYDVSGKLMEHLLDDKQKAKLKEKRDAVKKAPPAVLTEADDAPLDAPPEARFPEDEGLVNLEQWLRGESRYRFSDVQKAIRDRYHKDVMSKAQAALFLLETTPQRKPLIPRIEVHSSILAPPEPVSL